MCDRFKKHVFKCAKAGFESELLLTIFKADKGHIRYLAHLINLAQAVLTSLKGTAKKHTKVLYNNTKFLGKLTYSSAIGKLCQIIVRYCCLALIRAALA
jgi:hypothetical protein